MRISIHRSLILRVGCALSTLVPAVAWALSPEVEPGQHEYVVWLVPTDSSGSLLLPLTGQDKAKYCAAAQEFARRTYDVTNGRHTIRKVTFVYDETPPVGGRHVTWKRFHDTPSAGASINMFDEDLGCKANWGTSAGEVVQLPDSCPPGLTCNNAGDRPRCLNAASDFVPHTATAWGWVLTHEAGHAYYGLRDEYLYPTGQPEDFLHICNNPQTNTSLMAHRDRDHWCDADTHLHQRWILGYASSAGGDDVQVTEPSLLGYDVWTDAQTSWLDLQDYVIGEYESDPADPFVPAVDLCAFTGALADATPANDTMLVVDKSGSMSFKNSDSPMEPTALETAFLAALAHYNSIPVGTRNVGLLLFDAAITEAIPYAPRTSTKTADEFTFSAGGFTDLCLAVSEGAERVRTSGATMPRGAVVLLTDGRPTEAPCDNQEAVLAAVLDACLGDPPVDVWPVAFGNAEYELISRLSQVCETQAMWIEKESVSGQENTYEIQAALLRQGYRVRSYQQAVFDRSPTVADHSRSFSVPPGTAELEVIWVGEPFVWIDPDVGTRCKFDQLGFELLDPDGNPQGVDPVVPADEASYFTRTKRVARPVAGTWTMRATAGALFFCRADNPSYQGHVPQLVSLAELRNSSVYADVEVSSPIIARNQALLISAVLNSDARTALTDINVTAQVSHDSSSTSVTLHDDGTHGDAVAGDGRYTGTFNDCGSPLTPGAYRVVVTLEADESTATPVVAPTYDYALTNRAAEPGAAISATLTEERAIVVSPCLDAEEAARCGDPQPPPAETCRTRVLQPTTTGISLDPGDTATDVEVCVDGVVLVARGVRIGLGPGVTAGNVRTHYDPVADRTCLLFDATAGSDAPPNELEVTVGFGDEVYTTDGADPVIVVEGREPAWSLHLGVSDPLGSLAAAFDRGLAAAMDYQVPISSSLSWDLRLGLSTFERKTGGGDFEIWDLSGNLKFRFPASGPWWWLVNGGAGLYWLDSNNLEGGYNLGVGIGFQPLPKLSLEGTWNRHATVTATPEIEFNKFMIGLVWTF